MGIRMKVLVLLFILTGCQGYYGSSNSQDLVREIEAGKTVTIKDSGGGLVGSTGFLSYLAQKHRTHIIIDGTCASACTLFLSSGEVLLWKDHGSLLREPRDLDLVCYMPDALFGFHAVSKDGLIREDREKPFLERLPPKLADYLQRMGAMKTLKVTWLTGLEISKLDIHSRLCRQ